MSVDNLKEEWERLKNLEKALQQAGKNADLNDLKQEGYVRDIQQSALNIMEMVTGKRHYMAEDKDIFAKEPFNQVIHRNLDVLNQIDYLTTDECTFLWKIQAYVEFKSNVIICREDKFSRKPKGTLKNQTEEDREEKLPKAATISDIANMLNISRKHASKIMNSLKKKEILLSPEGAGTIEVNGRIVTPRAWIVNPYIICCAPRKNQVKLDTLTKRLFQNSLKRLTDQNGKKVKLPARFF